MDKNSPVNWYGESSTTYCIWEKSIERIANCLKKPKIIMLLRHPVDRLISHYRWLYALDQEHQPILNAISIDGEIFDPDKSIFGNYKGYLYFSEYATRVPKWKQQFGEENLLLLRSENLHSSPKNELDNVWEFLDIPQLPVLELRNDNTTDSIPAREILPVFQLLKTIIGGIARATMSKSLRDTIRKQPWHRKAKRFISGPRYMITPPIITEEEREQISAILKDHINFYDQTTALHTQPKQK